MYQLLSIGLSGVLRSSRGFQGPINCLIVFAIFTELSIIFTVRIFDACEVFKQYF